MFVRQFWTHFYNGGNKIHEINYSSAMPFFYVKKIFINFNETYFNGIQLKIVHKKKYESEEDYYTTADGLLPMDYFKQLIMCTSKFLIVCNVKNGYKYRLYNIILSYSTVTQNLSLRASVKWKAPGSKIWQKLSYTKVLNK